MIHVLYFASIREQLNCSSEEITFGGNTETIANLIALLSKRTGDGSSQAWFDVFSNNNLLFSVNQVIAKDTQTINDGDEVAFFPQVTGG